MQPVHGGLVACQCGCLNRCPFPAADYPPRTHFVEPPLRLLLERDGRRCDFHKSFRGVNLRLAYVVSKVSLRNSLRNAPERDYKTQTVMLTGLVFPITAILRT